MSATTFARLLGWVLVIVGVAGFFVDGTLLFFEVDTTHNVIHIASGVLAFAAVGMNAASMYLKVFGIVYGLVTVLGFAMNGDVLGLLHVNMADNLLHAAISATCLFFGFSAKNA